MELFAKIVNGLTVIYFHKKVPSKMFDKVLHTFLLLLRKDKKNNENLKFELDWGLKKEI